MSTYNSIGGNTLALQPTADHTDKRGYAVINSSGDAALSTSATDIPLGVIVDGQPTTGMDAVALCGSGAIVKVKLHSTAGTVVLGTYLILHTDGTGKADGGSGNRVRYARALQTGADSALVDAVLINPISLS